MDQEAQCPVCGSKNLVNLYSIDSEMAAKYLVNYDRERFIALKSCIDQLWQKKKSSFLACRDCSFEFAWPFLAGNAEIYSLIYHSHNNYPTDKWEYQVTFKSIDAFILNRKEPVHIIEIGAGNGSFIKGLLKRKPAIGKILATEYSDAGAKAIESLGIQCLKKDFIAAAREEIKGIYDIVCLFQVLEHMTSLNEFFESLNQITNKGSKLFISVPNHLQRKFFDRFKKYYDLPPIHVGRYNPKCLNKLSTLHGWYIVDHQIQPSSFTDRLKKFLFEQFAHKQSRFASEKLKIKFFRLFIRYGLYLFIVISNFTIIVSLRRSSLGTAQWFALERLK